MTGASTVEALVDTRAALEPLPPQRPAEDVYTARSPCAHDQPHLAPKDFRTPAPWSKAEHPGDRTVHLGSGVTFAQAHEARAASLCAACASADARCIDLSWTSVYSHGETTTFTACERECLECGKLTNWEHQHTS